MIGPAVDLVWHPAGATDLVVLAHGGQEESTAVPHLWRGHGLGRFVVSTLVDHPELKGVRRFMLATADAHELYRSYGFSELADPSSMMAIRHDAADLYGHP